jgi:hypothetical protein
MQTNVYAEQDAGATAEIDNIVRANLQGYEDANGPAGSAPVATTAAPAAATPAPLGNVAATASSSAPRSSGSDASATVTHVATAHP